MIERITPRFKFACDRCGKEQILDHDSVCYFPVCFETETDGFRKNGELCRDCYKDFVELAELFFDESNKEKGADNEQR